MEYFTTKKTSKWSLIGYLKWRDENQLPSEKSKEHSAFKAFLKKLSNDENGKKAKKAKDLLNNWKQIKNSAEIKNFWINKDIQRTKMQNELKTLQIETED
ncbi:475_t:CDS:2, partial [Dentiscutata erythropus]